MCSIGTLHGCDNVKYVSGDKGLLFRKEACCHRPFRLANMEDKTSTLDALANFRDLVTGCRINLLPVLTMFQ